jgi:hypothetical protein
MKVWSRFPARTAATPVISFRSAAATAPARHRRKSDRYRGVQAERTSQQSIARYLHVMLRIRRDTARAVRQIRPAGATRGHNA